MNRKFKFKDSSGRNMFSGSIIYMESLRIYRKFKTEDSFTINMFRGSIMDYCLLVKHQKESMSLYRKFKFKTLRAAICSVGQLWTNVWLMKH